MARRIRCAGPSTGPPSTTSVVPDTNAAAGDSRKWQAQATSSGSPIRPTAVVRPARATSSSDPANTAASEPSVRISPGHTALTRTRGPHSAAIVRARCSTPALAAPYAAKSGVALPAAVADTSTAGAAGGLEQRVRRSQRGERGHQVEVELAREARRIGVVEAAGRGAADVGDDAVETSVTGGDDIDGGRHRLGIAHVADHGGGAGEVGEHGVGRARLATVHHDRRPVVGKVAGDPGADPSARAGHPHHAPGEVEHLGGAPALAGHGRSLDSASCRSSSAWV